MNNYCFKSEGATSEESLRTSAEPILYKSHSKINALSYAGPASMIINSTIIDKVFTEKLARIAGYVSLGLSKGIYKNAHIYGNQATSLDGIERICYVEQSLDDFLLVSEYSGNRGSKYSSLFPQLEKKLNDKGFSKRQGKFIVSKKETDNLVDVINKVIEDRENGCYELKVEDKIDNILIKVNGHAERFYYFQAYWVAKDSHNDLKEETADPIHVNDPNDCLRIIAGLVMHSNNTDVLVDLLSSLSKLSQITANKIESLKQLSSF